MASTTILPAFPRVTRQFLTHVVAVLMFVGVSGPLSLFGQRPPQPDADVLAQKYNSAMQAFESGDFQTAAKGIEEVLAMVVDPVMRSQMAPAVYTLGACYFNLKNYPKAVEVFQGFIKSYPNDERLLRVKYAIAQSHTLAKKWDDAIPAWAVFEPIAQMRDQSLAMQAYCHREAQRIEECMTVLEKLVGSELKSAIQSSGASQLMQLQYEKKLPEKAMKTLGLLYATLRTRPDLIESLIPLYGTAARLGDEFYEKQDFKQAITAYRAVPAKTTVLAYQNFTIGRKRAQMQTNIARANNNLQALAEARILNSAIEAQIEELNRAALEFDKLPDIESKIMFRIGQCYYEQGRKFETLAVYNRLIQKFPTSEEHEPSLYSRLILFNEIEAFERCYTLCDEYLKAYPKGEHAEEVNFLQGAIAMQVKDWPKAEGFFGIALERQPNSGRASEMRYHLANAKFMQGKYREAIAEYERYEKEFANGSDLEDVKYHLAVCRVFNGEWELALPRLKEYVEKYPNGFYVADARYRISVCNYASSEFEEVIQQTRKWLTDYANDPMRGEVSSLLGDALAATRQTEEAATAYMDATKHATTDEVLNYAVFEAGKMLQKLGRWEEVARHYGDFVNQHPAHYGVVAANYWICKAKSRTGDNEGAKQFTIDILRQFVNDPKKESVEQLFTQLAELCKKRPAPPKPAPGSSPAAEPIAATVPTPESGTPVVEATTPTTDGPGPVAAAAPALPPHDPQAEMEKWTSQLSSMLNNTGRARVAFGNAEMLKLLRQPDKAHQAIVEIALAYKPEELSSVLLGLVGDVFLERADFDRARACYEKLIQDHPKSDVVDYGYVGMGEVLYRIKQYDKALQYFADAAERFGAQKMRDAIMGRGKTLLELAVNKPELYEDAKKMYEQVAGVREWRGETTAESLYMLGQIEERRGRLPEAIAYYQRVFVTQQKWVSWVARSYLRAADCFDKLNRRKEAIAHLQEMGRRDKLRGLPEMAEAQKRLESWGL